MKGERRDRRILHGGGLGSSDLYIAGKIGSDNDALGNPKTLDAGKFGNPFSRLNFDPFSAAELGGLGLEADYAVSDARQPLAPVDTKFRRSQAAGDDRFSTTAEALVGDDKTKMEAYLG